MLIETSLVLLVVVITSFVTRYLTVKELTAFLFISKRHGDYSVYKKLFFARWLNVILVAVCCLAVLVEKGVI